MHRIVVLVVVLCATSHAHAAQHVMRVSEVVLSDNGSTGVQFVEFSDANNEPFPANPYQLVVYDADGTEIDQVSLTVADPTSRFFVATAAADTLYGTSRDATLDFALPTDGQVCFQNEATRIHCLAWGCVNTVLTSQNGLEESGVGASPPDGSSVQRNGDGTYFVGTPTPDAANLSGVPGDNCATDPDAGAGGPPDAGAPDANPGEAPDASGGGGDDDGGGGGGCCRVGGGADASGLVLLALGVMFAVRRRVTRR